MRRVGRCVGGGVDIWGSNANCDESGRVGAESDFLGRAENLWCPGSGLSEAVKMCADLAGAIRFGYGHAMGVRIVEAVVGPGCGAVFVGEGALGRPPNGGARSWHDSARRESRRVASSR